MRQTKSSLLCVAVAGVLFVLVIQWFAPVVVRRLLLAKLSGMGLRIERMDVRQVTWHRIEIAGLHLADAPGSGGFRASLITVDYSPLRLFGGIVDHVSLSGVEIVVEIASNGLKIAGFEDFRSSGGSAVRICGIDVESSGISVGRAGKSVRIPFRFGLKETGVPRECDIQAELEPFPGEAMRVSGRIDTTTGRGGLDVTANGIPAGKIATLAAPTAEGIPGILVDASARLDIDSWQATCISAQARLQPVPGGTGGGDGLFLNSPLDLDVRVERMAKGWRVSGSSSNEVNMSAKGVNIGITSNVILLELAEDAGKVVGTVNWHFDRAVITAAGQGSSTNLPALSSISISSFHLNLPVAVPPVSGLPMGWYGAESVSVAGIDLRSCAGSIGLADSDLCHTLFYAGKAGTPVQGMELEWKGSSVLGGTTPRTEIEFGIPEAWIEKRTSAGVLHPKAESILFSGGIGCSGLVSVAEGRITGRAELKFRGLNIECKGRPLSMKGIDGSVVFSDLPGLVSDRAQTIRFERLDLGTLPLTNGTVVFSIDGGDSFLVERAVCAMCEGRVSLAGFRVSAGGTDMEGIIDCDRIQLARLLGALNWVRAEGTGELGGGVPFSVKGGDITVENGNLQTMAGTGGTILIRDSGFLTRSVPEDDPRYMYVCIAEEAMKDFRYDWARVDLGLKDGRLNAVLKMHGAPNHRLPFSFNTTSRTFVRTDPKKSNANFDSGIDLEIRLNDMGVEDIILGRDTLKMFF